MADEIDQAQALEERQRELSLGRQAAAMAGDGREDCAVCGEPIGEERRRAMPSATRCIECQERRERWRKGRRK